MTNVTKNKIASTAKANKMINQQDILEYIESKNIESSIDEINSIIENEDREKIAKTQRNRFRYEIWDKKTHKIYYLIMLFSSYYMFLIGENRRFNKRIIIIPRVH